MGRLVKSDKLNDQISGINMSELNSGVYFYKIFNGDKEVFHDKIVKQ